MMDSKSFETYSVLYQNKFEKLCIPLAFIIRTETVHIDSLVLTLYMLIVHYVLTICINDQ